MENYNLIKMMLRGSLDKYEDGGEKPAPSPGPRTDYYQASAKLAYYKNLLNEKLKAKNPEGYADYFAQLGDMRKKGVDTAKYVQTAGFNDYLTPQEVKATLGEKEYNGFLGSVKSVNAFNVAQGKQPLYGQVEGEGDLSNLNYGRRFASLTVTPSIDVVAPSVGVDNPSKLAKYSRQYSYDPNAGVNYTESGDPKLKPAWLGSNKKMGGQVHMGIGGGIDTAAAAGLSGFASVGEGFMQNPGEPEGGITTYPWQMPIAGFNALANGVARLKKDHDFNEYDRLQQMQIQQPEVSQINRPNRYGTFEDGGAVGSMFDSVLGISKNVGALPSASFDPATTFTSSLVTGAPTVPVNEDENVKGFVGKYSGYTAYKQKADAYLQKVGAKGITGDDLAMAAANTFIKHGTTVPVELALAQLTQEGFLAKGKTPNKPQRTNNPFNVGNVDSGAVKKHQTVTDGIQTYFDLMATKYLTGKTADELLTNFTNGKGKRYASDPNYEAKLKNHIKTINKAIYQ